jgi:nucleoside-diphosphate-sugar epimerase
MLHPLLSGGHDVVGLSAKENRNDASLPWVAVDVLDERLTASLVGLRPDVVVDQLTRLPRRLMRGPVALGDW